ncbi:unnamed protein product [Lupinus luteus]|uniref:Uncharacterized protein n=1 Tax=Lupinus luteus TaxID=3873 RepID=A0AAV1WAP8_LUPLU
MDPKSTNKNDEVNAMMVNLDSNITKEKKKEIEEEDPQGQDLANILAKSILESYQQFCAMRDAQISENVIASLSETQKNGEKIKNPLVAEQDVTFSLPKDCDLTSFKDMGEVLPKLEGWKIQSTQRPTKTCDTEQRVKKAKKLKKIHTSEEKNENPKPNCASIENVQNFQQAEGKKDIPESSNSSKSLINAVSGKPYSCYQRLEDISDDFSIYDDLIESYYS